MYGLYLRAAYDGAHTVLAISNLVLAKNEISNAGINTWFLVLCRNGG